MWQVAETAKTMDSARHSNFENGTPYNDCFAGKFGFSAMILFYKHRANYPAPPKWTPCGVQSPHGSSDDGSGKTLGQKPLPLITADRVPRGWLGCPRGRYRGAILLGIILEPSRTTWRVHRVTHWGADPLLYGGVVSGQISPNPSLFEPCGDCTPQGVHFGGAA